MVGRGLAEPGRAGVSVEVEVGVSVEVEIGVEVEVGRAGARAGAEPCRADRGGPGHARRLYTTAEAQVSLAGKRAPHKIIKIVIA